MSDETRVTYTIYTGNGTKHSKDDSGNMEVHDLIDYLMDKYVTKGSRVKAVFTRFFTEMSREEKRIEKEKQL